MDNGTLAGKVVVVTGASSGMGRGAARRFAEEGCAVVAAARREHELETLASECRRAGGRTLVVPTDVGDPAAVEHLCREALRQFGRIDVWVNDAGVGTIGEFTQVPLADHVRVVETNLLGTMYGSYFALAEFKARGEGTLINIASALGKVPAPYYASYTASKYGVVGLSASLRQELDQTDQRHIHVCTVLPMATDTPFFEHAGNYTGHETVPIPPLYAPEKVIDAVVRLATHPEEEVIIGAAGKLSAAMHAVAPGLIEQQMARTAHKAQFEKAPLAPDTAGAVHRPSGSGTTVSGGRLR